MPAKAKVKSARRRSKPRRKKLRILFTCVGRRVELLNAFRRAAKSLGIDLEIHGADINWIAPAIHRVDKPHIVPRIHERRHIPELLKLVRREGIDLVIPLIDSDLRALAEAREKFVAQGCDVLISDAPVIRACADKLLTFETLRDAGIDTPDTWTPRQVQRQKRKRFPYMLKPRSGSAGQGLYRVDNADELRVFIRRVKDCIVQEFVDGVEHTLDVYAGFGGVVRCVVPRRRLEVRTGEVSKGMIVKDLDIIDTGRRVVEALGGCRGVITVQCMVTPKRRIRVIEVNPRFGGGAPLSIRAGADFPRWIMAEAAGLPVTFDYEDYQDRLILLRYDESVFLNGRGVAVESQRPRRK